jgi:hypothetical protein
MPPRHVAVVCQVCVVRQPCVACHACVVCQVHVVRRLCVARHVCGCTPRALCSGALRRGASRAETCQVCARCVVVARCAVARAPPGRCPSCRACPTRTAAACSRCTAGPCTSAPAAAPTVHTYALYRARLRRRAPGARVSGSHSRYVTAVLTRTNGSLAGSAAAHRGPRQRGGAVHA